MSQIKHRIQLIVDGLPMTVNPTYRSLPIREVPFNDSKFLRPSLSVKFTFLRSEYDYVYSLDIAKEVVLVVQEIGDGPTYTERFRGVFTRTEVNFDQDNKLASVEIRPRDRYEKVIEGMDKEFDVVGDLSPELSTVTFQKRPIIQAYLFDSNFVTNFTQGNYWETPVIPDPVTAVDLVNTFRFSLSSLFIYITGDENLNPDISGRYSTENGIREDGKYEIFEHSPGGGIFRWVIRDTSTLVWVYQCEINEELINETNFLTPGAILKSNIDGGASQAQAFIISVWLRYLTDQLLIDNVPTFERPENDIVASSSNNYDRVVGLSADNVTAFNGHTVSPTPFGKYVVSSVNFAGEYFSLFIPEGVLPGAAYPVSRSDWRYFSLWFQYSSFLIDIEFKYSSPITIRNCYRLPDLVAAFLQKLDSNVSHSEDANHSMFFYSDNNPMRENILYPIFSPSSNVIVGDYDQPAKKAMLRFADLIQFLRDFYGVYWDIDANNRFILEKDEWFERGGTYYGLNIGDDTTVLIDPKTGRPWSYRQNQFEYDKRKMPEREEYNWSDPQSPVFDGRPIEMLNPQVTKGQVDRFQLSRFNSDVDYILVNGSDINQRGFVFFEAELDKSGLDYELPIIPLEFEGILLRVQNGYATLTYGHKQYHIYQLPCDDVLINDQAMTAESVVKTKIQEITFPQSPEAGNLALVRSELGDGKTTEREYDLITGISKLRLNHDQ